MSESSSVVEGEGYAVGSIDAIGDGYGFRKIRRELGVTAFGVNAIVMPPGYASGAHFHDEQEETYVVHRGRIEIAFGDGSRHELGPGGIARVDPSTPRSVTNVGDEDAVYLVVGGKDGYVGRDGRVPEGEDSPEGPGVLGTAGRRRRPSGRRVKSHTVYRTFETAQRREFVRITEDVQAAVDESGVAEGMVLVSAMHITAGVWVNDDEPGIQADTLEWLDKLAPPSWQEPANDVARELSPNPGDFRHHARWRGQRRRPLEEPARTPPGGLRRHRRSAGPRALASDLLRRVRRRGARSAW